MRIACIQNVPYEGPGAIGDWARARGHALTAVQAHAGEPLPAVDAFDLLVVMGGPMNADEDAVYPWIAPTKRLIAAGIEAGRGVLGVCLGAQFIARVLGAAVTPNAHREIGWLPVRRCGGPDQGFPWACWPERMDVLHWHGDTFGIPSGARRLASSDACANQGLVYGPRVLGLQFHLELTPDAVRELGRRTDPYPQGPYIQPVERIASAPDHFAAARGLLDAVLDGLAERIRA